MRPRQPKLSSQPKKQPQPNTSMPLPASRHAGSALAKQPTREYDSETYAVGSSLPSLSLLVPETPTQPQINLSSSRRGTRHLPRIDEIETTPPSPQSSRQAQPTHRQPVSLRPDKAGIAELSPVPSHPLPAPSIDQIDTLPDLYSGARREVPPSGSGTRSMSTAPTIHDAITKPPTALILPVASSRAMVSHTHQNDVVEGETASWTAGNGAISPYAQLIANAAARKKKRHTSILNPLDRVRWWLLHPGRIEFMLWIFGTILLIIVTCSFLLLTASSLNWLTPGRTGVTTSSSSVHELKEPVTHSSPAVTTTAGLVLTLLDKGPLLPGQPFHLHGQGFSHNSRITFTYDGAHQFLDQSGQILSIWASAHGTFTVTLWPGGGSSWNIGHHIVIAHDLKTNHVAALDIVLSAGPYGKTAPTPTTQVTTPGASPTAVPGGTGGGGGPTPVGQTPVPVTPTVTSTPSPAPSPSPTQAPPSPTSTSTPGTTATATRTPRGNTTFPQSSNNSGSSNLGNVLSNGNTDSSRGFYQARFNPLVILVIGCYTFAIILLGMAGALYKRRK